MDLFRQKITFAQFGLLVIYAGLADWDFRHKAFAVTDISDRKFSNVLGLGKDRVGFNRKILWAKGYIELLKGKNRSSRIKINRPEDFFHKPKGSVSAHKDTMSKIGDTQKM